MEHLSQAELLALVSQGNRKAYSRLYNLFLGPLYEYLYSILKSREEAEEHIQEIFLKIWLKKESLSEVASFQAYVFTMARNQVYSALRQQKTVGKALDEVILNSDAFHEDVENHVIFKELLAQAREGVELLPEKRRQIFNLSTQEDHSLDEISEKLKISKSVVKKQLYKALAFMRTYVGDLSEMHSKTLPE